MAAVRQGNTGFSTISTTTRFDLADLAVRGEAAVSVADR
jgi:hypothetical protein